LAIDSGAYDAYETPQWYNYYVRTIAHNTIVVDDPDEKFISRGKEYARDGGQRFINEPHFQPTKFEHLAGETYRDGTILAYREGEGWSYVCGDASNCYRKEKLTKFLRHVTFILDWPTANCVSTVILDEIELPRPDLEPRFLLHTMDEPAVDGNRILSKYGGGRMTASVLLPATPKIEKIGGPGREFEVNGVNYPLNRKLGPDYKPGAWRAEITGTTGRWRRFLTVLNAADIESRAAAEVSLEETPAGLTVRQGELSVTLSRSPQRIRTGARRAIEIELAG
jgi:heparin/heparan-sulfate lyase